MKIDGRNVTSWLVSIGVALALLVYGRTFLVPLAFALMLWAILNALKNWLKRASLPNQIAWLVAFALIAAAFYLTAFILVNQAAAISDQVPAYSDRLTKLWMSFRYRNMIPMLDIPTLVQQTNLPGFIAQMAASIGEMLFELILVAIYVGFLLAEQAHLPRKIVRLQSNAQRRGEAADVVRAIAHQIQSYIGVCTFLSALMALTGFVTLKLLGVDFAAFWALVLFFVTYIPTVGAIAAVLPALTALAQFGTPGPALIILAVLVTAHFFLSNVLMSSLLGRSLDLSPFIIMVSLTFWGLVWGVAGLFLAVPVTGAIAITCRHVEGLEWVAELIAGPPPRSWSFRKLRLA